MPSRFQKGHDRHPKRAQTAVPGPFSGLRGRGTLLAAFLVGTAVFAAGHILAWKGQRDLALETGDELVKMADAIERTPRFLESLEHKDGAGLGTLLKAVARRHPEVSVTVWNAQGEDLARLGPHAGAEFDDLSLALPLGHSFVMGDTEGGKLVEHRRDFQNPALGATGSMVVRAFVPSPTWRGMLGPLSIAGAVYAALLAWLFLARSLRGTPDLVRALQGIHREEYWHRVPVMGCAEQRVLAEEVNRSLEDLNAMAARFQKAYVEIAEALARTVEAKDRYTSGHSQRVARYAVEMGRRLGFDKERLNMLYHGGLLHDIGKVATPDAVLLKPGPLTDQEYEEMKKHPMDGDKILGRIPGMRDVADIARSHHERWDGKGYPLGQAGEAIPLEGRMVAIADAYDSMVTRRSYKPALPVLEALDRIESDAGTHFDPELARMFVAMKRNGVGYKAVAPAPGESEGLPRPAPAPAAGQGVLASSVDRKGGHPETDAPR